MILAMRPSMAQQPPPPAHCALLRPEPSAVCASVWALPQRLREAAPEEAAEAAAPQRRRAATPTGTFVTGSASASPADREASEFRRPVSDPPLKRLLREAAIAVGTSGGHFAMAMPADPSLLAGHLHFGSVQVLCKHQSHQSRGRRTPETAAMWMQLSPTAGCSRYPEVAARDASI